MFKAKYPSNLLGAVEIQQVLHDEWFPLCEKEQTPQKSRTESSVPEQLWDYPFSSPQTPISPTFHSVHALCPVFLHPFFFTLLPVPSSLSNQPILCNCHIYIFIVLFLYILLKLVQRNEASLHFSHHISKSRKVGVLYGWQHPLYSSHLCSCTLQDVIM